MNRREALLCAMIVCSLPALAQSGSDGMGRGRTAGFAEPTANRAAAFLPEEPAEYDRREVEAYYDWRNDLFFRRFDLRQTGTTDFMTARRTYRAWVNEFGSPVAVTMAYPLFYWLDVNGNGEFEPGNGEMWSDPEEDGVNGNEQSYDPSPVRSGNDVPVPRLDPRSWEGRGRPGLR